MSILKPRDLNPLSRRQREEIEAGGRWVAFGRPDPGELVAEIRERGVRSLETFAPDLGFLREVPQIEFLVAADPKDVAPIHDLPNLRSLFFSGDWGGRLDFAALPKLESFGVNECPRGNGGLETLFAGHPSIRDLSITPYRFPNLLPLGRLALQRLWLTGGLTSLAGAEELSSTLERLGLDGMPNLLSLDGMELLPLLEVVEIWGLRNITTLDWAARLPRLRLLSLSDQKGIESLGPLAGHPTLEFLTFGAVTDLDLEPLGRIANLRLIHAGKGRWNRNRSEFPSLLDMGDDHPARRAYYALKNG